jgi:tRNA(Ile)-lysidine synthase
MPSAFDPRPETLRFAPEPRSAGATTRAGGAGWELRWSQWARASGIASDERLLLALSGGADSVLLLQVLAAARPRVRLHAVHVDHGLRGAESDGDVRFCERLCASLGVGLTVRRVELSPRGPSLESRARSERYRCLLEEAERTGHRTVLTGHHSDDALETLIMRWVRGSSLAGMRGPRPEWRPQPAPSTVRVVRPLLALRREEVRRLLTDRGLRWREDRSNRDPLFTRNRLRHGFLPMLERIAGAEGIENLRAFGRAVESLEGEFARATAHLAWKRAPYVRATRDASRRSLGGVMERRSLMELPTPLRRRALWRLLLEGTGLAPTELQLAEALAQLSRGRTARQGLAGGWHLLLRSRELHLVPPPEALTPLPKRSEPAAPWLPFPPAARTGRGLEARLQLSLELPGIVTLDDGRRISAEVLPLDPDTPVPRDGWTVELDAGELGSRLAVRWPEPGDRFRALGAPGAKSLTRYLADRGVPREERGNIPLVFSGEELLWVCGLQPCERRRVAPSTRERLRLSLHG